MKILQFNPMNAGQGWVGFGSKKFKLVLVSSRGAELKSHLISASSPLWGGAKLSFPIIKTQKIINKWNRTWIVLPKIWSNSSKIQNRDMGCFFEPPFLFFFPYPIVASLLSILLQPLKPKDKAKGVESAPIVGSRQGNLPL